MMRLTVHLLLLCLVAGGCATARETSVMTQDDLNEVTAQMSASLAASDFLRDRTANSPPITITIDKVENLTSDLLPPAEQWMLMARLQGSLPLVDLRRTKNITFQVPPERGPLILDAGYQGQLNLSPIHTHTMTAVFRSATRVAREEGRVAGRVDLYRMEYKIFDITHRDVQWTDEFMFKREAIGGVHN